MHWLLGRDFAQSWQLELTLCREWRITCIHLPDPQGGKLAHSDLGERDAWTSYPSKCHCGLRKDLRYDRFVLAFGEEPL